MIFVEDGINLGSSCQRLLKRLSKTNSVRVERVVGLKQPVATNGHIPTREQLTRVVGGYSQNVQSTPESRYCFRAPSGTLMKDWSPKVIQSLKEDLIWKYKVPVCNLVRESDLGIRTPKSTYPVGIILTVTVAVDHDLSRETNHKTASLDTARRENTVILIDSRHWYDANIKAIARYQAECKAWLFLR